MIEYITKDKARELVCSFCQWEGTSNCEECEHPVDDVKAEANGKDLAILKALADAKIDRLERDLRECRNELCLKCGAYTTKHLGSCNGCKWEKI